MEEPKQREEQQEVESPTPHVVMMPSPGMGHLIPLVEFAKRLVLLHRFTVTFVIPSGGPPSKAQISVLSSLPSAIDHVFLPPPSLNDLPPQTKAETIIVLSVTRSLPSLRDQFKSMVTQRNLVAFVVDQFGTIAFDLVREFNVPPYVYLPCSATTLSLILHMSDLDKSVVGDYTDLTEPIRLPACSPIPAKALPDPFLDRKDDSYKYFLESMSRFGLAEGIFVNSFPELEPNPINALKSEESYPPIHPVGPIVKIDSSGSEEGIECLNWLDEQPHGSVLFVSFGSGGTLSSIQNNELAMGLEMSGQKFIWVVRSPHDKEANASFFSVHSENDPLQFLPEGFVERNRGRGLVLPSWAPQAQILSHGSTGGFLSHCGWNSTLESLVNGVPLIAWPLYAEQKLNSVILTEEIKVALKLKMNEESGIIEKEEIAKVVKSLFESEEGQKVREKMEELRAAGERAVGEGGSSSRTLLEVVQKWRNKVSR
ncbi:hydroquinone glucosyltransferase-like [Cucumis melo]|uniref:Glycosyltransferase n=1 Tax=Cucumis melo TaxID=3656 RepID=A0A1S3AVQ7_CUCME|nr:hydroquinone glucosyltransferase-like [Cucumis melo]